MKVRIWKSTGEIQGKLRTAAEARDLFSDTPRITVELNPRSDGPGYRAEYFPLGAGGGTSLVCAPSRRALEGIIQYVNSSRDVPPGRAAIPFKVTRNGVKFSGFKELGLNIPEKPALVPVSKLQKLDLT